MDENMKDKKEELGVDLQKVFSAVLKRTWLVVLVSVLCAALVYAGTVLLITPRYQASAKFYVNNSARPVSDTTGIITSSDLATSRYLVQSYMVILNTGESLDEIIAYAEVDRTPEELSEMITAAAINETEIFEVTVTSTDPWEAERIANAIAHILPERIAGIIDGTSAKVVDTAKTPTEPSYPNVFINTVVGFLVGFVLVVGIIVVWEIFDVTIRSEEDLTQLSRHPILAAVPDMLGRSRGGYYNGAASKQKRKKRADKDAEPVGSNIPFAAAEAYKLLRTKIQYSFADDQDCHVIGVSSALAGEGKSTTSINLACALAQLNKKVLLIDCDLRRPSIASKLGLDQEHGLSGFLTKQSSVEQIMKHCRMDGDISFMVVPAGPIPPNPTELLSSARMEKFVELYAGHVDYIILDQPPVEEVSDALAASKLANGVLLAVRQNYCSRLALEDAVRQFEFVDSRILGFLMTYATESGTGYGKSYYKRYYNRGQK